MRIMKFLLRCLIYIGAAGVIIRAVALVPGFSVYFTDNPWDWLTLALVLSPVIPLVLFLIWGKPQKSILGRVSPAKQVFMPWWMVDGDSSIAKVLGKKRPIWQMALWILFWLFVICLVVMFGAIFLPQFEDFMSAYVR
jgi:hypothetical protein